MGKIYFHAICVTTKTPNDVMAGLVVKLGLGFVSPSYVKPGNSGSGVWSIQTLANFSKLVLKFNHAL